MNKLPCFLFKIAVLDKFMREIKIMIKGENNENQSNKY
jgi:hypothetical protein